MDSSETSRHDEYSGPSSPSRRGQRQPTRSRMQQVEQADIPRGFSDQPLTEHELILPQSEEANIQDGSVSSNSRLSYISAASRLDSGSPGRESSDRSQAGSAISESLVHDHVRQSASAPLSFIQEPAEETPNYVLSSRTPPSASPSTPAYEPDHDGESNALFNATSEDERETSESENRARIRNWRNRSVYSNFVPPDTDSAEPPSSRQDYHTRVEDTEDEEYRHRHARNRGKSRPTPSDWESDEMDGRYSGSAASHTEPKTSPSLGTTGGNRVPYPSESFTSESGSSGDELDYRESDEYSSRSEGNRPQRFSARDWPRNTPPPPFPNPFAPRYPDYYQQPPPPPQYIPPVHYPATSPYVPTHYPAQYGQDNYSHFYHPDPPYNNATSGYNYPPPPPTAPSYRADSRPGLDRPPVENTKAGATAQAEAVSTYKPPVSSDASAHALSMDISLKSSSSRSRHDQETHGELRGDAPSTNGEGVYHWKTDHSLLRRSGRGHLTRIQSLELYTDRAGRDRVTMFKPLHSISSQTRGGPKLFRWLHLEQQTLCLDDLQKLTFDCPFLDKDLKSLADRLLRQQCTKFEKRYSNGVHSGHYIEPGTVLRCDSRHDQVLNQKAESVIFCSVPYLHLDKQERQGHDIRDSEDKIHPTRTLMESLYDYELMENRDDRQAVLRCSSPEQENIVYVPQIWYLLCGSDVLISCSQLSLADLSRDSIRVEKQIKRSLVAIITDLDRNKFSVSLKTTDSYYSAIRRIDSLRSNVDNNPSYEYDFVLDTGEHLTPKKWLDIVKLDPLPLLKMRMNPRCHSSNSSRALIVLEKKPEAVGEKKLGFLGSDEEPFDTQQSATLHNTTQYQEHVTETRPPASALQDPRLPPQADASLATYEPAYPLTSYTGTAVGSKVGKGGMMRSKPTGDTSEDESTLIGSVMSRQENDSRRINALKSQGIVVNDVDMVSKAPEVLGFVPSKTEPAVPGPMLIGKTSKPNVWDYLDEQGDSEEDSSRDRAGCDARASKVSHDDTNILQHPSRESQAPATPVSPVEARAHDPPLVPFFHWDKNKTAEECRGSDVMVRQVLDEIHHRLFEHNDHWRIYKRGSDLTLEDLQTPSKGSLFSPPSDTVADPILNFRSTSSSRRKHELFDAIKFLVEMFIPPNFEHDTTKKIWGAMNKICQTLDGILNSTNEESFIIFQTQDYTNDKDLVEALRIPALKRPMKDCSRCQSRFMTLEEGLRHLNEEHFEHNVENGLEAETRGLYLRTTFQIEIEARVNAFLSLIEGCTKTFQEVGKTAKDMLDGTVKSADHVETKGYYPVVESLVRVFEHIVIILVFSADFMAKADKTMRTDRKRALDCGRFATKLRGSLNQIIRKAQKDLDQAKRDIILASNTDYDNDKLASIGPEFMVALVSNGLFFRRLDNASAKSSGEDSRAATSERDRTTIDASELYKRYANKLQLQVNQRPQKRLLPDIYAFEEEVEILQKVIDWQMKFCHDFYRVLDPNSYKITTKTRISHFNEERRYLHKTIDRLKVRSTEFTGLLVRSARLRDQLQQSIEIEEESHGNAIRVFTFVTLFFLPLSFVTSFFGMNTVDIRDSDQNQAIFWIASVPTTAVVLGLAYIYGYKWEGWQDRRRNAGYARRIKERGNRALRSATALADSAGLRGSSQNDPEKGGMTRRGTDMSVFSQYPVGKRRKRVRFWGTTSDNDDNGPL